MSKETKPEMTAEQFAVKWGCRTIPSHYFTDDKYEDKSKECLTDLNSVIRGKLYEFADWYIAHEGYSITNREIDMFLSNNPC